MLNLTKLFGKIFVDYTKSFNTIIMVYLSVKILNSHGVLVKGMTNYSYKDLTPSGVI